MQEYLDFLSRGWIAQGDGKKYYFSNALSFDLNITKIKIIDNNQLNSLNFQR